MGIYQCQILAGPRRSPSMSRKAKLTVLRMLKIKKKRETVKIFLLLFLKMIFRNSNKYIH